jgi:hypothetical protein
MVLEGAMMIIACGALTVGHPGRALGSIWQENAVQLRKRKIATEGAMEDGKEGA